MKKIKASQWIYSLSLQTDFLKVHQLWPTYPVHRLPSLYSGFCPISFCWDFLLARLTSLVLDHSLRPRPISVSLKPYTLGVHVECMWAPQGQSVLILLSTVLSTSPDIWQRALNGGKGILWLSAPLPLSGLPSLNSTQPKIPRFQTGEETEDLCPTS